MKELKLKVSGMHCPSCETLVKEALEEISGVKSVTASHKEGFVKLQHAENVKIEEIKKAIEKEGYKVVDK